MPPVTELSAARCPTTDSTPADDSAMLGEPFPPPGPEERAPEDMYDIGRIGPRIVAIVVGIVETPISPEPGAVEIE